jgi:uncharacterized protein YbaP (TraB family)
MNARWASTTAVSSATTDAARATAVLAEADLAFVADTHERVLNAPLDSAAVTSEDVDPVRDDHVVHRMSSSLSIARDHHMIDRLRDAVRAYRRVFAVVGASHVVMQEAVLRARLAGLL